MRQPDGLGPALADKVLEGVVQDGLLVDLSAGAGIFRGVHWTLHSWPRPRPRSRWCCKGIAQGQLVCGGQGR